MSERKYTKQELWMAFDEGRTKHYLDFQDFFTNTFPISKPPFDLELEKHEVVNRDVNKVLERNKDKPCAEIPIGYTRENFIDNLANTLTVAGLNVSVADAEKIFKIYGLVQVHGGKVTMDQINKIKVEG